MKFLLWISHGLSVEGRYTRVYICCSQIQQHLNSDVGYEGILTRQLQRPRNAIHQRTSHILGQSLPYLFVRNRLGLCPVVIVAGNQEVTVTLLGYKGLGKRGGLTLSHKSVVNLLTPHCFFWANMFKSRCKTEF